MFLTLCGRWKFILIRSKNLQTESLKFLREKGEISRCRLRNKLSEYDFIGKDIITITENKNL